VSILLQKGKDSGAVKIVPQLPGGDGLGAFRRKVGQSPPALLDGHALPQKQSGKLVIAGGRGQGGSDSLPQLFLVRFKLGGLGRLLPGWQGCGLLVQLGLPFPLRPVFTLRHSVFAAIE